MVRAVEYHNEIARAYGQPMDRKYPGSDAALQNLKTQLETFLKDRRENG